MTQLYEQLRATGRIAPDGAPGPHPLVDGGFARARVETFPRVQFASSGQGGFRVSCPVNGSNQVQAFNRALEAWRDGGPRTVPFPCGHTHDLVDLHYDPDAGFARGWLALIDVQSVELVADALEDVERWMEGVRIVVRRG